MASDDLRLFVAVSPPQDQLHAVDRAIDALKSQLPGARWAPVANQHTTLKFLGATAPAKLPAVAEACERSAARHHSSEVRLRGLGAFPSGRRARVVWVGIEDEARLLRGLAGTLDATLQRLGYVPEKRAFRPHLTLARLKTPLPVQDAIASVQLPELSPFAVRQIVLYRSRLSPRGATYEAVASFPLSDAR